MPEELIKTNDNFDNVNDAEVCGMTYSCMTINTFSLLGLVILVVNATDY